MTIIIVICIYIYLYILVCIYIYTYTEYPQLHIAYTPPLLGPWDAHPANLSWRHQRDPQSSLEKTGAGLGDEGNVTGGWFLTGKSY